MNYLSYTIAKCYADAVARLWPIHSLAIRKKLIEARPQYLDEKLRFVDTMSRMGLEADKEYATLVPQLALLLFKHLPQHRQLEPKLAAFLGQVLQWTSNPETASHAQIFQDYWVLFELGSKRDGYFIEFGAADGIELSNTLLLEQKFGWKGLLAEPNPENTAALRRNRTCSISNECVWNESGRQMEFVQAGYLSTLSEFDHEDDRREAHSKRVMVDTISLVDLLVKYNAPRDIDFLSIDTEGSEFEILSSFDFDKFNIACIAVEHNYGPRRQDIFNLLSSKGYKRRFEEASRWDDWYMRSVT